jgi:hypothetical protein
MSFQLADSELLAEEIETIFLERLRKLCIVAEELRGIFGF